MLSDTAERRQLTIMFCDLVDSVRLSTRLDPEDLRDLIAAYQRSCVQSLVPYDGYIARYLGDGLLVYFGYPVAHEDDAERAIRAGLDLVSAVDKLNTSLQLSADSNLKVRVGIATGTVVVGDLITEGVSDRDSVVGEAANLAARLQGIASPNTVVISDMTRQLAGHRFEYSDLGPQQLKGFSAPVPAFAVTSQRDITRLAARGILMTPFVGRKNELDVFLTSWERAASGNGQIVVIVGEAGTGKSRIVAEAVEQIQHHTGSTLVPLNLQFSPYHSNAALYPVIKQIQRSADIDPTDPPLHKVRQAQYRNTTYRRWRGI